MPFEERRRVDVEGGVLTVGCAGPAGGPAVLCLHGISSSHLAWLRVARLLLERRPDVRVLAPDLRGRGRSDGVPGPFGLSRHAADAAAVLDAGAVPRAVVAGHSMGGWVAARLAAEYPDRVAAVVLVDGGIPLRGDPTVTPEDILGPAVARLRLTFASAEEYVEFWRGHPAYSNGRFNADVEATARYDLRGEPPELRPRAREEAVRADFEEILDAVASEETERRASAPTWLVRAGRGLLDQPEPFLDGPSAAAFAQRNPAARVVELPEENHYTVTLGEGAAATAQAIAEALG